jgi:endonuclease-3
MLGPAARRALFERLRAAMPEPATELVYRSNYQLLVSVILSAQATDKSVNHATGPLFRVAGTPAAMVALGEAGLAGYIRTIGLWRMKAKHVLEASRTILARHGGEVPRERAPLEALPGVGRKTANVVLNTAFGEPTIAVDTHIFRVANRTGLAPGRNVRAVEDRLVKVVPEEFRSHAHHWLLLHGRYVCKARRPLCPGCPIRDLCLYQDKTPPGSPAISSG